MEILVLSSLARVPMHGYELKPELRYKHVRWWAKCDHGHLYAALARLARRGDIRPRQKAAAKQTKRRVFAITPKGMRRLRGALEAVGSAADITYFDVDLFLSGAFALDRDRVLAILAERRGTLRAQRNEAEALRRDMSPYVPAVGRLIIDHRIEHLVREEAFLERALEVLTALPTWGPYLGRRSIGEFARTTGVRLEEERSPAGHPPPSLPRSPGP
jgi:DNA-binding PadR family transcriptional regulator